MAGLKTLYVYTMQGCEVCAEAKPIVEEFKRQHLFKVLVVYVDATRSIISLADIDPKTTPSFAVVDETQTPLKKHEGLLTLEQLNAFVFGDFGTTIKKKRERKE